MTEQELLAANDEDSADTGANDPTLPPRKLWIIVLLALIAGPFALAYCGRLQRAVVWLCIKWCVAVIVLAAMLYLPFGRLALFGGILLGLAVIPAIILDAYRLSKHTPPLSPRGYQRWWGYAALLFAFLLTETVGLELNRRYVSEGFLIPRNSMAPTLTSGDRILANKLASYYRSPQRGELIVFVTPDEHAVLYTKRVIALEGDTIAIDQDEVRVNGTPLEEPYVQYNAPAPPLERLHHLPTMKVPAGHVFVLGDNRWQSQDSRFLGPIPQENIIGLVRLRFWSRELDYTEPTRQSPLEKPLWGEIRWDRIGTIVQ